MSDARTGFTRFIVLNEKPPDGCTWSGRRLTRTQTTSRPDNVWPDMWKHMSDASKRKEKQKWQSRNQSSKMPDSYVVSSLSILMMKNFRHTMKTLVESWKFRCQKQRLVKLQHHKHRETCCTVGQHKTKDACVVEADESMRIRMEGPQNKNHEDRIAGRDMNSLSHYNVVHKFILCLKPGKYQMQRQQWKHNGKNYGKYWHGS